jgi:hypothetical protein
MSRVSPRARRLSLAVLSLLVASAAPGSAQSLFAGAGLGYQQAPSTARAAALGGLLVAPHEPTLSLVNPAAPGGLLASALGITVQSDDARADLPGGSGTASTVRFPAIQAALPVGQRWVLTAGYGTLLDQAFRAEHRDSVRLGGESVGVMDSRSATGGVATLHLGGAFRPVEALSLGATVVLRTGSTQHELTRVFDDPALAGARMDGNWSYRGIGLLGGALWSPGEAVTVGAAVGGGGSLEGSGTIIAETPGGERRLDERSYSMPITVSLGVTGRVGPGSLVTVSGERAGWSAANDGLTRPARDTWFVSAGLEWDALRIAGRDIPLRLGARHKELPFAFEGEDWAAERSLTAGLGIRMAGDFAQLDLSAERGSRGGEAIGIEESFWRLAFTATVLGR